MRGAVSAGRLVNGPPAAVTVMMTGTSPAPASEGGSVTVIWSKPGVFDGPILMGDVLGSAVPMMSVVPMRTVTLAGAVTPRTPVTRNITCVATVSGCADVQSPVVPEPAGLVVITGNGSPGGAMHGLVTLSAAARPPGPFVEVKMSGC